jgi:glycosyltransferase involved in cell wall biosynthesis
MVAEGLSKRFPDVSYVHLEERGRGRALRHAWMQSKADIVCYMDVDLSTGLEALPNMISIIAEKGVDIAVGSRLMKGSRVRRSLKREIISRSYNIFLRACLSVPFSDAQCGFKAIRRDVVKAVVPQVEDQSWFFDTELLVLAHSQGYRITDMPIVWNEDDDSRVKILRTAWDDIKGVFRLRRQLRGRKQSETLVAGPGKEGQ